MSLPGFEQYTKELTDYERDTLLPVMVKALSKKIGRENAVTNRDMVAGMKAKGFEITDARVRKIISVIRSADIILGLKATSAGYYVTDDPQEIREYIDSLEGRINKITHIRNKMASLLADLLENNQQQPVNKAS